MGHRTSFMRAYSNFRKTNKANKIDSYVWIDLEMTGLEVETHTILEAACIITKPDLNPVHEGIHLIIHQPEEVLNLMNVWSKVQHAKSSLIPASRESKLSLSESDQQLADYIKRHTNSAGTRYLAGNSVYMDKRFLEKYMPLSNSLLHYKLLDVTSLKILCGHWFPEEYSNLAPKNYSHRAFDDILESIEELKTYQKIMFK